MHVSSLNFKTAFVVDCVIFISVTLCLKYCPLSVRYEREFGTYIAISLNCMLLLLKAKNETELIKITFSFVCEHSSSVPFSPYSPLTSCNILTDKACVTTKEENTRLTFSV